MIAGHDAASHEVDFRVGLCQTRICGIFRKCASVVITAKPYCIADAVIQISFVGIGAPALRSESAVDLPNSSRYDGHRNVDVSPINKFQIVCSSFSGISDISGRLRDRALYATG